MRPAGGEPGLPGPDGSPAAAVTTVVASRNRWPRLAESLPRHSSPVILVDNGSTDDTVGNVRRRFPSVRVVPLPVNQGAVARNVGVAQARTRYVAFADDDSWWAPGALAEAAALFDRHPRLALLAGRILIGPAYVDRVVAHHHPQPVAGSRAALASRNRVLTAVLRRPWSEVARITFIELAQGNSGRRGVLAAAPRLARAVRRRRRLPGQVEAARRVLDRVNFDI